MRSLLRVVQTLDGFEATQLNADEILPQLMIESSLRPSLKQAFRPHRPVRFHFMKLIVRGSDQTSLSHVACRLALTSRLFCLGRCSFGLAAAVASI